jgi:signal transduction histidine kinase
VVFRFRFARWTYLWDAVVGGLLYGAVLALPGLAPRAELARFSPTLAMLGLCVCAPLVVRRRWPVPVLAVVVAATGLAILRDVGKGPLAVGFAIAMGTVALHRSRRVSLAAGGVTVVVLGVTGYLANRDGWDEMTRHVPALMVLTGLAIAVGEAVRGQRAHVAEVEERARRADRLRQAAERMREAEARRRVAEERLRIARDVHDLLGHHIALINVQAGVATHLLRRDPDRADEALGHIRRACRATLDELGTTLGLLRAPDDPHAPVEPSAGLAQLDTLLASFTAAGLRIDHRTTGDPRPLPAALDLTAYRVIQEALTNARKHAGRTTVALHLDYRATELSIEIDNGPDPDTSTDAGADGCGHGLIGMRERAAAVGGTLAAGPTPSGGYRVRASLPLPAAVGA